MISIKTFVFNPFQENTYLLYNDAGNCFIIDAGCYDDDEFKKLTTFIEAKKLTPNRLFNTHGHVDHVLGNIYFKQKYGLNAELHALDVELVKEAVEHGRMFGIHVLEPPAVEHFLNDGDTLFLGDTLIEVRHVPGHSPGSIAFYCPDQKFVITGDALFSGSIGRTDLPGGSYSTLLSSIKTKLLVLDDDVTVYPGHGPSTTIGMEKKTNPFLI
jgi:hydroxyacylglutathione hydrolase